MTNYIYQRKNSKNSNLKIFEYTTKCQNNAHMRILVLSDLHIFSEKDIPNINNLIKEAEGGRYDAIFLVGDIVDATAVLKYNSQVTGILLDFIRLLGSLAPTFIAYGKHDLADFDKNFDPDWMPDELSFYEEFLDVVAGFSGVNVDANKAYPLKKGHTVSMINPTLKYDLKTPGGNPEELMKYSEKYKFLSKLNPNFNNILLCHYPNAIITLYQNGLLSNVSLGIAGHNHNGMTQIVPLEIFLNLIGETNRGLITSGMSMKSNDTKYLRGVLELDSGTNLLLNPAIKTFTPCTGNGNLEKLDSIFYKGASVINYIPEEEYKLIRAKK